MRRTLGMRALGSALIFAVAALLGFARANGDRARFDLATAALSTSEQAALEAAPAQAIADAIWALGTEDAVKKMLRAELERLPEAEGAARARTFVRFGIVDSNPDGQAAVFFQACVSDPSLCDRPRLIAAAEHETRARLVEPGQHLPLYLTSGHPQAP
ncbi:MAG TPA: hypothetical protein VJV79_15060 [Polyangiaceae bacterium]|nr:hypothetical protein [Polyangiaceae bacterium]